MPPRDTRVSRVFGLLAFERLDARLASVASVASVAVVAVVDEVIRAPPRRRGVVGHLLHVDDPVLRAPVVERGAVGHRAPLPRALIMRRTHPAHPLRARRAPGVPPLARVLRVRRLSRVVKCFRRLGAGVTRTGSPSTSSLELDGLGSRMPRLSSSGLGFPPRARVARTGLELGVDPLGALGSSRGLRGSSSPDSSMRTFLLRAEGGSPRSSSSMTSSDSDEDIPGSKSESESDTSARPRARRGIAPRPTGLSCACRELTTKFSIEHEKLKRARVTEDDVNNDARVATCQPRTRHPSCRAKKPWSSRRTPSRRT